MLRVNNAKVCPNCDALYDGPSCPSCSSRNGYPLRRWLQPMSHLFFGGDYNAYKTCLDTVQEKSQDVLHDSGYTMLVPNLVPSFDVTEFTREEILAMDFPRIVGCNSQEEQFRHQLDSFNHRTGKSMESQRYLKRECDRPDAGSDRMDTKAETPRDSITKRLVRSGKKYFGWLLCLKNPFKRRENIAGGVESI